MPSRSRPILIAGIASLSALLLPAGRDACAQQVTLTNSRGLDFGSFVAGTGGTVVMSTAGLRSKTGGVVLLNSPSAGQAQFGASRSGSGSTSKAIVITLPSDGGTRLASGSNSMAVNSFVSAPASITSLSTTATPLSIGATLTVAPNQAPGSYSGSFSLIVNYQ